MKTLIIFYSYSGKTKAIAEKLAADKSAEIAEIKDVKRPGKLKAYITGISAAIKGKAWAVEPLNVNLTEYEHFIMLAPVWANNPAPAFNAIWEQLPSGKTVSIKMVSMSGKSDCKERLEKVIKGKDCILESFEDIKV